MKAIHLDKGDMTDEMERLFKAGFPGYNGRKFKVRGVSGTVSVRSYWDGGSRDYYAFVRADGASMAAPTSHPIFDKVDGVDGVEIPNGSVLIQHSIFCGKDSGLTMLVPESRLAAYLPKPADDLTPDELIVLELTAGLKAFARRERAAERGIDAAQWQALVTGLADKGYLRANGAITPKGRNASPDRY